ncbi:mfsd5 [Symbiodinium microadriaticum]|nr:mfsd5 [Symbiodinium microadriaticum]
MLLSQALQGNSRTAVVATHGSQPPLALSPCQSAFEVVNSKSVEEKLVELENEVHSLQMELAQSKTSNTEKATRSAKRLGLAQSGKRGASELTGFFGVSGDSRRCLRDVMTGSSSRVLALVVWVGFKVHEATSAHALGQGFLEPDDLPGVRFVLAAAVVARFCSAGKDLQGRCGQARQGLGFGVGLLTFLLCLGVGLTLTLRTPHGGENAKFLLQFQALVYAISWRHTHQRAIVMHSIRIAIPALMLMMINRMQSWLLEQIGHRDSQQLLQMTGLTPKHVVDGVVEYTLSLALVYVAGAPHSQVIFALEVMVSMLFFVWPFDPDLLRRVEIRMHVAAEKQSGFRHLLHVSGLSRGAPALASQIPGASHFLGSAVMLAPAYLYGCICAGLVATTLVIVIDRSSIQMLKGLVSTGTSDGLSRLQRIYLSVYLSAMMADWLQGPFVYALYASYGFSREDNATLFVAGFGSSALFGTFIGSMADKYGRRRFAASWMQVSKAILGCSYF